MSLYDKLTDSFIGYEVEKSNLGLFYLHLPLPKKDELSLWYTTANGLLKIIRNVDWLIV